LNRTLILAEPVTDFLTLSEWGYVQRCTLGTGLKEGHVELLKTLPHLAAVPHNDEAGWKQSRVGKQPCPTCSSFRY